MIGGRPDGWTLSPGEVEMSRWILSRSAPAAFTFCSTRWCLNATDPDGADLTIHLWLPNWTDPFLPVRWRPIRRGWTYKQPKSSLDVQTESDHMESSPALSDVRVQSKSSGWAVIGEKVSWNSQLCSSPVCLTCSPGGASYLLFPSKCCSNPRTEG